MNEEQKQIEEMAKAIFDYVDTKNMRSVYICGNKANEKAKPFLHNTGVAEFMYEKGYRKQSDTVRDILGKLKFLYAERQKKYTNWDGNKINAVATEWLNADIETIAAQYGVEVEE